MQRANQQAEHLRSDRVRQHTAAPVNERIDQLTRASIDETLQAGPEATRRRLNELDQEWDVDRALMVNFAVAGAVTSGLGFARYVTSPWLAPRRKGFLVFFGAQLGFLLLHGIVGWCPPASVFRRLGFRTPREMEIAPMALLTRLEPERETERETERKTERQMG
jgi:hypothetical protein